ncbi:MAG: hypothetical protein WDN24_13385 [Sphingomonas sp.]
MELRPGNWQTDDDTLLAFIAGYGPQGGTPLAFAVVIRGTDTDGPDAWSIINQVYDDVDVLLTDPIPWSNDPDNGYIAQGTSDAFSTISAFNFPLPGATLQSYVVGLVEQATAGGVQPYLFVVGHSLGGCMASVFAPDLAFALGQAGLDRKVVSATFAAPTAGDQVFVDEAQQQCWFNFRYRNDRDIVPRAWADLSLAVRPLQRLGDRDGLGGLGRARDDDRSR